MKKADVEDGNRPGLDEAQRKQLREAIKRTGRGYRNHDHYQARVLLRSARQTRRRSPLNQ